MTVAFGLDNSSALLETSVAVLERHSQVDLVALWLFDDFVVASSMLPQTWPSYFRNAA